MFGSNVKPQSNIYKAVVIGVNPTRGTCNLRTTDTETRYLEDVPWASPFTDLDGNGIDFCPVEDQYCYVLESTSNAQDRKSISSVIIGWCFPEINGAYGDGRERLNRNDIKLSTRKGAKVLLDASQGDLLVQSGPACGITMYRMANFMHVLTDSYQIDTRGGSVSWDTFGEDSDYDKVRYSATIKSSAGDEVGFLRVLASSDETGDFFTVRITGPEATSGQFEAGDTSDLLGAPTQAAYIRFGSDGKGHIHTNSQLNLSANDKILVVTKDDIEFNARSSQGHYEGIDVDSYSDTLIDPEKAQIASDNVLVDSTEIIFSNRATGEVLFRTADDTIHDDSSNKRLFNEDLAEWLFNHTHPTPSGPTLPPLGRPSNVPLVVTNPDPQNPQPAVDFSDLIAENEINAVNQLRLISALTVSVSNIITAVSALDAGASANAILAQIVGLGILPPNADITDLTGPDGFFLTTAQDLNNQADDIQSNRSVDANGTLREEDFGIPTVEEVMTKDTKVR
jgi:hypothetical protein